MMAHNTEPRVFLIVVFRFSGRRKATPTHNSNLSVPNGHVPFHSSSGHQRVPSDIEEEDSDGEMDDAFEWNWRDDSKWVIHNVKSSLGRVRNSNRLYTGGILSDLRFL